ncbi:helix-turn-helix domain-containing protein [Micromonospora sp. NPDC050417]|uniref:helix-turn-helix domain-containing protein n=1 Tax=Micromonospora sp. NPDC050417 TaxID=3364280 RepID=UPI003789159C
MPRTTRQPGPPTLRSQWLGEQLRELRLQEGMTLEHAAGYLGIDRSGLARFERAEWPFKRDHVLGLLDCYQVYDPEVRARLLRQQEEAWRIDIFDTELTGSIYDETAVSLTWLERRAELIGTYTPMVIPGLLQTPAYIKAIVRQFRAPANAVEPWVERRMARQQVLSGPTPPRYSAIVEEVVLRHQVGGRSTMRDQLAHLIEVGRRPNIEVRVLPPTVTRPDGSWGQFIAIRLPEPYGSVGYQENLGGRFYFESSAGKRFIEAYDRLRAVALPATESAELITTIMKEWA